MRARGGAAETIQPVAQLVWSEVSGGEVPDEDSRVAELDEGNLFALNRFPGQDRSETGARLNLGVSYDRIAEGWQFNGYVGRILRFSDEDQFDEATGLNGKWSDWLVSGQVGIGDALTLTNRAVFDDNIDFVAQRAAPRAGGRRRWISRRAISGSRPSRRSTATTTSTRRSSPPATSSAATGSAGSRPAGTSSTSASPAPTST